MKRFLWVCAVIVATALNAQAVTFDFESVAGLTPLNTNVQGTSLPANSSIVAEVPGLVISSLGPFKNAGDINGDGSDDMFSGVSWLDFTGTTSTAHSGTKVITGASDDPTDSTKDIVDFTNFVEFRLLDPGTRFFRIWVEVLPGTSVTAIFRDQINGGGTDLNTQNITASGFASFFSTTADIRNVVFIPVGGNGIWLDDLTIAATDQGGGSGSTVPEPGSLLLLASGGIALAFVRKKKSA